jgi:hypothetical protein
MKTSCDPVAFGAITCVFCLYNIGTKIKKILALHLNTLLQIVFVLIDGKIVKDAEKVKL